MEFEEIINYKNMRKKGKKEKNVFREIKKLITLKKSNRYLPT